MGNFKHFNSYIGLKPILHLSGEADRKGYMTYLDHQVLRSSLFKFTVTTFQQVLLMLTRFQEFWLGNTGK
ncbi:transposase [Algoriphagus namhaensis]|uniref:Transposase n=1 Tax=Algoriphagus namhaensis TaxID=915353 RepID=A0ABV8AP09_9BACT